MQHKLILIDHYIKERPPLHANYRAMTEGFLALDPNAPELLMPSRLADMNANIPLVNGVRTPGSCNVLMTYVPLQDESIIGMLRNITDEVVAQYPAGFDLYRVPEDAFHISLVMLHDIRPVNMDKEEFKASILGPAQIEEVKERLAAVRQPSFSLTLEGVRFGPLDGSMIGVFSCGNSEVKALRTAIETPVKHLLKPELLMHEKNLIHTTLLRPLQQLDSVTLQRLQRMSRTFVKVAPVTMRVDEFQLGLERKWQHTEIDVLGSYRLV